MALKRIDYRKYHPILEETVTLYLDLLDTLLPEKQKDLYLIGSIADDDFQAGRSDIDFAIVSDTAWNKTCLAVLAEIHRAIPKEIPNPMLDGVYLTRQDLLKHPDYVSAPYAFDRDLYPSHASTANPITWSYLKDRALVARGRNTLDVAISESEVVRWCKWNLEDYWLGWIDKLEKNIPRSAYGLSPYATTWGTLGISRTHATIHTKRIISKSEAAEYARRTFGVEWYPLIEDAHAFRTTGNSTWPSSPFARRKAVIRFMREVAKSCVE